MWTDEVPATNNTKQSCLSKTLDTWITIDEIMSVPELRRAQRAYFNLQVLREELLEKTEELDDKYEKALKELEQLKLDELKNVCFAHAYAAILFSLTE